MGANAQTTVPLFATGDELTAAGGNLLTNGVAVFSGTATRDAAFGGASEKVLAEGQACYLEDSDQVQIYTGAAFVNLAGLRVVQPATSFTSAGTVNADNIFTSLYTNYEVDFRFTSTIAAALLTFRFRSGGVTNSTTNYYQVSGFGTDTTADTSVSLNILTSAAVRFKFFQPQLAAPTFGDALVLSFSTGQLSHSLTGFGFEASTQFDGFQLVTSSGTITGSFTVYGYAN
jgi:hypothetical protein